MAKNSKDILFLQKLNKFSYLGRSLGVLKYTTIVLVPYEEPYQGPYQEPYSRAGEVLQTVCKF